jgi:hypothetical protein
MEDQDRRDCTWKVLGIVFAVVGVLYCGALVAGAGS